MADNELNKDLPEGFVIAYTTEHDKDGNEKVVQTVHVGDGEIEEREVEADEAEADENDDEVAPELVSGVPHGHPHVDNSNDYDLPEPPEKTEQQLHDEKVTAANSDSDAGPANAGTSTGEWVDDQ